MNYRHKKRRFRKLGGLVDKWRNRWGEVYWPGDMRHEGDKTLAARYYTKYEATYAKYCHLYMNPAFPYGSRRNL